MSNFNDFPDDDVFYGQDHTLLEMMLLKKSPEEKKKNYPVRKNLQREMQTLGLDMTDDSLKDSPNGLPKCMSMKFLAVFARKQTQISTFSNKYKYQTNAGRKKRHYHLFFLRASFLPLLVKPTLRIFQWKNVIGLLKNQ